jgi:molecular chaperone GrpE
VSNANNTNAAAGPKLGLVAALEQGAKHLDDLRRVAADFDNYRKRTEREQQQMIARISARVVEALLPALDDLDLALRAAEKQGDVSKLAEGVKLVRDKLHETLGRVGVERIDAENTSFDPNLHDAVMDEGGDGEETVVVEEMRPGYRLADHVIRPAMVKVGRR